jgi:hypothetical protein
MTSAGEHVYFGIQKALVKPLANTEWTNRVRIPPDKQYRHVHLIQPLCQIGTIVEKPTR